MKIIVGLGNPTEKYENTRHNVGFKVLDCLASRINVFFTQENKFKAQVAKGLLNSEQVLLVKPQTFMNLSGDALALIMGYYKVDISEILVVYDDIALDMGTLRFRANGSDVGHNGIKSVTKCLGGNKNFARLKVGIGPQPPYMPSERFVLGEFTGQENLLLKDVVSVSCDAIECFISSGISVAQNKFNGTINP
ncbi:aminoacyl-tRNA hydrolase [bacterium]|nr:aminoacyl-tRNA hydrolase [bacterium]